MQNDNSKLKTVTPKRILIDGRFIGVGESISRYTLELVKGIISLDRSNEYTLLVRPQAKSQISNLKSQNYGNLSLQILDIPHYSVAEQTKLLRYLNKEKFDLVHFTQFNHPILYRGKFVVTIHDLTLIGHLHRQSKIKSLAFGRAMKSAVRNSAMVIASSKTTEKDLFDYYQFNHNKISVIYLGLDHKKFNSNLKSQISKLRSFKEKYQIHGDYFLYTGMWKKHKNLLRMLKAFEQVNLKSQISNLKNKEEDTIKLVLVGKVDKEEGEVIREISRINSKIQDTTTKQYSNSNIQIPIVTTGFIPEEELPTAYAGALAYVMPSLSEGFGWPPLEAMACGSPVISSNVSCMPEILGDAPLYFDPYKIDDIADKMTKIASLDIEQRKSIIEKGLQQVKKYNWQTCAKKTLAVYRQVLN